MFICAGRPAAHILPPPGEALQPFTQLTYSGHVYVELVEGGEVSRGRGAWRSERSPCVCKKRRFILKGRPGRQKLYRFPTRYFGSMQPKARGAPQQDSCPKVDLHSARPRGYAFTDRVPRGIPWWWDHFLGLPCPLTGREPSDPAWAYTHD